MGIGFPYDAAVYTKKIISSACGLCAFFLRHIFAVAGMLRIPLSQPQKRHIQPERYTPLIFELVQKKRGIRAALKY
jgi:hypothetical protein